MIREKIYNIGVVGEGKYRAGAGTKNKHTKQYSTWHSMLKRCYSEEEHDVNPCYIGCKVCDEWLNLQTFGEWFDKNYKENYQLDKDLLVKGNKIYSPTTCCFVPQEINLLLVNNRRARGIYPIGVSRQQNRFMAHIRIKNKHFHLGSFKTIEEAYICYKEAKEKDIKERASEYKLLISKKVYNALMNYTIDKND